MSSPRAADRTSLTLAVVAFVLAGAVLAPAAKGDLLPPLPLTTTHQLAAACHYNPTVDLTPGPVLQTTTTGMVASQGAAPLDCLGTLDGAPITGVGTIRITGSYTGSCASGSGALTDDITLPTANGSVSLISTLTFSYLGGVATFTGAYLSGVFSYVPLEGDCVTTPMTRVIAPHIALGKAPPATTDTQGLGSVSPPTSSTSPGWATSARPSLASPRSLRSSPRWPTATSHGR